jgi:hypothetical protein
MNRARTRKPRIRHGRSWLEILPADPRDPDVVRAKALAHAHRAARSRRMRELTDLSQAGGLPDAAAGARR